MKMSVLNSMAKFLDSLIGSSKFDVGIAYDELGEFCYNLFNVPF